jgi:hypothetical protein
MYSFITLIGAPLEIGGTICIEDKTPSRLFLAFVLEGFELILSPEATHAIIAMPITATAE